MLDFTNWNYVGHNCINATPRETPHTKRMWAAVRHRAADWTSTDYSRCRWNNRGDVEGRDVNETLALETETFGFWSEMRPRPRVSCNSTRLRRDQDVWFFATRRDRDLTRPRPRRFSRPSTCSIVPKQWVANLPLLMSQTAQSLQLQCSSSWNLFTT